MLLTCVPEPLARRNHRLTTVCRAAPVALELARCCVRAYDRRAATAVLRSVGLSKLIDRLPDYADEAPPPRPPAARPKPRPAPSPLQPSLFG